MDKNQIVAIVHRLHSDRQAAQQFVRDPASEWQALGGQMPQGVTPAQFSQNMRNSAIFKEIQATANGQMSASLAWTPCTTGLMCLFGILGITGAGLALAFAPAIAAFLAADVGAVETIITGAGGAGVYALAVGLCHGT